MAVLLFRWNKNLSQQKNKLVFQLKVKYANLLPSRCQIVHFRGIGQSHHGSVLKGHGVLWPQVSMAAVPATPTVFCCYREGFKCKVNSGQTQVKSSWDVPLQERMSCLRLKSHLSQPWMFLLSRLVTGQQVLPQQTYATRDLSGSAGGTKTQSLFLQLFKKNQKNRNVRLT